MGIFDQIGASISKTAKEVSEGAKTLSDKNRVRKDIAAIENELRNRFREIGEKLYELTGSNPDPEFAELFAAIAELKTALTEKNQELIALDGKYACPKCGTVNPRDAKFCQSCGTPAPEMPEAAPAAPAQGICANCGAPLAPNAVFCAACGTKAAPAPAQPEAPAQKVCPNCGTPFEPGALFCAVCGNKAPDVD